MKKSSICSSLFLYYYMKQIDSMLPRVCWVIDHRRRQNLVRTSVIHSAIASYATFLFLPHFDVICELLLNRRVATRNLFGGRTEINYVEIRTFWIQVFTHRSWKKNQSLLRLWSERYKCGELKWNMICQIKCCPQVLATLIFWSGFDSEVLKKW